MKCHPPDVLNTLYAGPYAVLSTEAKHILEGVGVTGHRPANMLKGSPATSAQLRSSNPILYSLQQPAGPGKMPLKKCALVAGPHR